jgi:hypothetical protein
MTERSRGGVLLRRACAFLAAWLFAAALYFLLIDITDLPELIVGAGAAVLAAGGFELAREQDIGGLATKARWLVRLYKPFANVPSDVAVVSLAAVNQLLHPRAVKGEFRAVPFRSGVDEQLEGGKRALAESFGSFAPNTIIVGVDGEREMILGHQLRRKGGPEAIDVLELG